MTFAQPNFSVDTMRSGGNSLRFMKLPQTSLRSIDTAPSKAASVPGNLQEHGAQAFSVRTFEERVFDALLSLKVIVGQISMHLSREERYRLFDELDSKINVDDWHEDDRLPDPNSFRDFLKWIVFAGHFDWTSIGVSAQGATMVAWRKPTVLLTATFEGADSVRWTARVTSEMGEIGLSTGKCTLRLFARQAMFYLG